MEERFQTDLRCRRRAKGELLRELAQDIRRLMALAYPGEKSSLSEHIARDAFLIALDDPEFALKMREREPKDLDEAVKIAQRYEVFRGTVDGAVGSRHRAGQVTEEVAATDTRADFNGRLADLELQLQAVTTSNRTDAVVDDQQSKKKQFEKRIIKARANRSVAQSKQAADVVDKQKPVQPMIESQVAPQVQEIERLQREFERLKHVEAEQLRQVQTTQFCQTSVLRQTG